jgi:hypothetical protein
MPGTTTGVDVFGSSGGSSLSPDFFTGYFGDGSDGDASIVGTFLAGRELHYNNLTIPAGTIFKPNGYRIFVLGTLTIDVGGSFNDDGRPSISNAGATALGARNYLSANGLNGGNAFALTATGFGNGTAGGVATNTSLNNLGQLTSGGRGGNVTLRANTGGLGGVSTTTNPSQKWNGRAQFDARFSGGGFNGGSGGGGGAINVTAYTSGTFISGGGGSGGGIVYIAAKSIINQGKISSEGGNGFDGSLAVGSAECAGGGGGGGGCVGIVTTSSAGSLGVVSVAGGGGGTGVWNVGTGVNMAGVTGASGSKFILVLS